LDERQASGRSHTQLDFERLGIGALAVKAKETHCDGMERLEDGQLDSGSDQPVAFDE
jgi:hypothetical protein